MESNSNISFPLIKRIKDNQTIGSLDTLGFFRTPNGSFWDPDEEYFNKDGFDIHGGTYSKDIEYIPGADWLSDLGCYPEEKDKYMNGGLNDIDMDDDMAGDDLGDLEAQFKGDFEDDFNENEFKSNFDFSHEEFEKIKNGDKEMLEKLIKQNYIEIPAMPKMKKNKSKSKKKIDEDEEGWETVEEDEDEDNEKITNGINKLNIKK